MKPIDRRTVLSLAPAAFASCGEESPYFGNTQPPSRQQLTYALSVPSPSLDPASFQLSVSRGRVAPSDRISARWADGQIVTVSDFVRSWRRLINPATAASRAYLLYCVRNVRGIYAGKIGLELPGVRAADTFTFRVELETLTCSPSSTKGVDAP